MKVLIRADASLAIGSGHIMRCLCLADALHAVGNAVCFASRGLPLHLAEQIRAHGHEIFALEPGAQADEIADAAESAMAGPFDLVVVDHYGLGRTWETRMRGHARLLAIDDLGREHDSDWLLDQNFHPEPEVRYAGKVPQRCVLLLGPRHALLRAEFREARKTAVPRSGPVRKLLVFLGGMDADNVTGKVLEALDLAGCDAREIDVVIGASQPAREQIEAWCETRPGMRCHVQAANMAQLFAGADLAVGAGGTTTWERCAVGLPTLALCLADNQHELLEQGARHGFVYAPQGITADVEAIALHVRALLGNEGLRHHLSVTGMTLVDGGGAHRVVAAIAGTTVRLRVATSADAGALYAWRNHPRVRAVSRNTAEFSYDEHLRWMDKVLNDPQRHLLIGERDGEPVGVLRFDVAGDEAEVSIYLAPDHIGRGDGAALLRAGEEWLRTERPAVQRLNAWVNAGNAASERLFDRCGYDRQATQYIKRI
ncbi:UDP-2,4-diacetamido-2,4,6-trideoxy-beta-L-altropyranose hydrolase [Noviherbaspirillum aridicola]|uniref:UDP-2,4-diacetamido-2,4, 6-trideoxy-beta-L-altropyranose hydrolase n=1 Tax=Noviherbaspirillum aridicola TaxID=2849687 RepID=A0ABQ4Q278_9BURK|nr:UDP-2,4-diacetamido-2,4,6-trideoxy-beta-L-altropyranose hydrolase [Noviherbaspirillum aridicola]GIZ51293.1 UDP-2,4-diacetamido-2,4,6-trideoxy-beta-L-altropyranose hydrolase [Noviherbaspirillum aridicola]